MQLSRFGVVHLLDPRTARTFSDYAGIFFQPYIDRQLQLHETQRIALVGIIYIPDSLMSSTRQKRGKGIRRRVLGKTNVPNNWKEFLRVDTNKVVLFECLTNEVMKRSYAKRAYMHLARDVCYARIKMRTITRTISAHAITKRLIPESSTMALMLLTRKPEATHLNCIDTDILVLHAISQALGSAKPRALPKFHSFTVCDTVSAFAGKRTEKCMDGLESVLGDNRVIQ